MGVKGLGLPCGEPETLGFSETRLRRIEPAMRRFIDAGEAPGLVCAIARLGRVAYRRAMGEYEEDTLFRIYSLTKPVTAVAVMALYELGEFLLDDPIERYLPEFNSMQVWDDGRLVDAATPITIRHLLTHTSGISYPDADGLRPFERHPDGSVLRTPVVNETLARMGDSSLETHTRAIADMPLLFHPGQGWQYGESMAVLSRLVETISGKSYTEFLMDAIFEPLAMVDTGFFVPSAHAERLAPLYKQHEVSGTLAQVGPGEFGGDYTRVPRLVTGGTGLVSTAGDFLRFAQMLLNGGALEGERVLGTHTVSLMLSDQLGNHLGETPLATLDHPIATGRGLGFGFGGLVVRDATVSNSPGSNGEYSWSGWANTEFWIDPQAEMTGLAFTQVIPTHHTLRIRDRMRQVTYQALIRQGAPNLIR